MMQTPGPASPRESRGNRPEDTPGDDRRKGSDAVREENRTAGGTAGRGGAAGEPDRLPARENDRLLTPDYVLAWLVNFAQYLVFYLLVTTMAVYAVREFRASDAMAGFASSAFVVGATAARLVAGYLVDSLGHRRILLIAVAAVALMCLAYVPTSSLALLIAVRIAHGAGYAFASTATMTVAQRAIPAHRRAEGTGYFALGSTLATAVGPALGLFLAGSFGYRTLFTASTAVAVAGLVLALFLARGAGAAPAASGSTSAAPGAEKQRRGFSWADVAHPAVAPIGTFMLLVGLAYAGVITYLNAFAEERGLTSGAALFFVAYAVAMLVMRFFLGRVQDRRGDNSVIYLGLVFFVAALLVLAFAAEDWHVVLSGALSGLGYGTIMPAAQAIAVKLAPRGRMGTGISTLLLLTDVGVGIGPVALGFIVSAFGYGVMYVILAGVVVAAAVFYQAVHGRLDIARATVLQR